MASKDLIKSVIKYLEDVDFKFLRCLGEGGYGYVIAVRTPTNERVAIKIVEKHNVWTIEDDYWPVLQHDNVLEVISTMEIEELNVKLYVMPMHLNVLLNTVFKNHFKQDANSFNRVKKWCQQILAAVEFLHFSGLCHLDIKSDNILLDSEDNALLCDFSGLNYTSAPVNRVCSPYAFRPKECFPIDDEKYVNGQSFDMWTFGFLVLNLLTDHYPQQQMYPLKDIKPDWETHVWPILEEVLKEANFICHMRKAFPCCELSIRDIHEALHFVKFIMNIQPEKRPNASRAKMHPFLKIETNPFSKEMNEIFWMKTNSVNPFRKDLNVVDAKSHGAIPKSTASASTKLEITNNVSNNIVEDNETNEVPENIKRKTIGKKVKNWFKKQFNKFKLKK